MASFAVVTAYRILGMRGWLAGFDFLYVGFWGPFLGWEPIFGGFCGPLAWCWDGVGRAGFAFTVVGGVGIIVGRW